MAGDCDFSLEQALDVLAISAPTGYDYDKQRKSPKKTDKHIRLLSRFINNCRKEKVE